MVSVNDLAVWPVMGGNLEGTSNRSTLSANAALIEDTRSRLYALAAEKDFDMQDPDVLLLSQELDCLIVAFEKQKKQ